MTGLYTRLAVTGIKKNKGTYFPYMLTCIGMIMMCYIVYYLSESGAVANGVGGEYVLMIMGLGRGVMALFSLIFLFYTHSFLIRGRKREFGLFNILGMNKSNIARIMLWETFIIYAVTLSAGLGTGILFSKLAELTAGNILGMDASSGFTVSVNAVKGCLGWFAAVYMLIFGSSLIQIKKADPAELLQSESAGEIPPKSNFLLAVPGALILAGAYTIAVTVNNPVSALFLMFIAVVMVIIATYILFTAGSSAICGLLRKNKKYYYKTKNFISVSQMNFRMKRNGAGLASICILSTMVLVTVSATTCLYIGEDAAVNEKIHTDFSMNIYAPDNIDGYIDSIWNVIDGELSSRSLNAENACCFYYYYRSCLYGEGEIFYTYSDQVSGEFSNAEIKMISLSDYNRLTGKNIHLDGDEILFWDIGNAVQNIPQISFQAKGGNMEFKIKGSSDDFKYVNGSAVMGVNSTFFIVMQSEEIIQEIIRQSYEVQETDTGDITYEYPQREYCLSFDLPETGNSVQLEVYNGIRNKILSDMNADEDYPSVHISSKADTKSAFFSMTGSLFFLGLVLGTVFIFAASLIMYYKQSSEGFEDRKRYEILQKVGMTAREIKSSINSQVLTVFFLPLIAAGVHLCFAFPILSQCLRIFMLTDTVLFGKVSLCCYGAFALFYAGVYLVTSREYYRIVKNSR